MRLLGACGIGINATRLLIAIVLALEGAHELLLHRLRHQLVVVELHGVLGAALGHAAERGDVLEHGGEGHEGLDGLHVPAVPEHADLPAARVDVADHVPHVLLGDGDLHLHDGLHEARLARAQPLLERRARRDLERQHRRVHVVVRAVDQRRLHADDREPRNHPVRHDRLQPLGHPRDVLLGDRPALDGGLEDEARLALGERVELDLDARELPRAARLLLVRVVHRRALRHRLAVRHLGRANRALNVELAHHAVDDDLQMQLAHALDDGLPRLLVAREAEGRVLGRELDERLRHLVVLLLRGRLHRHLDHRLREVHLLQDHGVLRVAERVARGGVLHADQRDDVARNRGVNVGALDGVHLDEAPDALLLVLARVEHRRALGQHARVDPRERERAHERVVHHLERERREGVRVRRLAHHGGVVLGRHPADVRDVERRRHVVDHRVEERLHALVLERSPKEDRREDLRDAAGADEDLEALRRDLAALEIVLHRHVVGLHGHLDELLAVLGSLFHKVSGDLHLVELGTERLSLPHDGLHLHKVNDARETALRADRELEDERGGAQEVLDGADSLVEVGADAIHLVDEAHAGHAVFVGLAPHGLGLRLDARHAVEESDGAVEHAEGALHLEGEVNVTGRVDDVDAVVLPEAGGGSGRDGDATLLLLSHPVHGGAALVHLTDLVRLASVIKDALSASGLAGVNVRHDTNVAVLVQRGFTRCGDLRRRHLDGRGAAEARGRCRELPSRVGRDTAELVGGPQSKGRGRRERSRGAHHRHGHSRGESEATPHGPGSTQRT
mmetsp:Transcript_25335/g.60550  ORF Transcript_25335/g.60550 Transcript_25335/m.60550 type:complete len:792 (-) Transcript_25335:17-2392(-)